MFVSRTSEQRRNPARRFVPAVIAAALALCSPAIAASLSVGVKADFAVDPQYLYLAPNIAIARHMFEPLVATKADETIEPRLAVSWEAVGEREWEFKLRPGVMFSDGTPFTAEDVIFSFERVRSIPNNPNPYTAGLRTVTGIRAVDPLTIRITTEIPNPSLPIQLRIISIVSHLAAQGAMPGDFASGKAAVGTGPFTFVKFTPGDRLELRRNDLYWGAKPAWDTVTFRILQNDASRVAALLARDVDAIDTVPPQDAGRLKQDARLDVSSVESDRIIYLALNAIPDRMEWFTDAAGKELPTNPFRDARVRLAVSKAFDRAALVARGLDGLGVPAGQMVPTGFDGYVPGIKAPPADIAGAKALLAEAGYPAGFGMTIACSNGRYVNDANICQLLGAMLTRIGIPTKVEVLPPSVYFSRIPASKPQYALMLIGWGSGTGSALPALTDAMHSYDPKGGMGANTRGTYNDEMDALIQQASTAFDAKQRTELMQAAIRVIERDTVAVPLYAEMTVLAARKGIVVEPRADQQTIVTTWTSAP